MKKCFAALLMAAIAGSAFADGFDFRTTGTTTTQILNLRPTNAAAPPLSQLGWGKIFMAGSIGGFSAGNFYISQNGGPWTLLSSFVGVGAVSSVFGRTGAVVATTGDYSVGQVTGAAPTASPTFTGVPAGPTAAPGTNTTQLATTAYVVTALGSAPVTSVFGRVGAVVAASADYTAAQVTNAADKTATNTFTNATASPIKIKPGSAPVANTKLLDMQATGAGTTNFSVDAEGDVIEHDVSVTGTLSTQNVTLGGTLSGGTISTVCTTCVTTNTDQTVSGNKTWTGATNSFQQSLTGNQAGTDTFLTLKNTNASKSIALKFYDGVVSAYIDYLNGSLTFSTGGTTDDPPGPLTATIAAGAGVTAGTHSYQVTFVTAGGETSAGTTSNQVTTAGGNLQVNLTNLPVGNGSVTSRKIYRTLAGSAGPFYLQQTIANNVATTATDNTADGSLGVAIPQKTRLSIDPTGNVIVTGNALVGSDALISSPTAGNVFIGRGGASNTGDQNTAIGNNAMFGNTTGTATTAAGYNALNANTTGNNNAAIGAHALEFSTTPSFNSAFGNSALQFLTTGGLNTAVGYDAGAWSNGLGEHCATNTFSTYIGFAARCGANGNTNEVVIGGNVTDGAGSNTVTLGDNAITKTLLKGDVGVRGNPTTTSGIFVPWITGDTLQTGYFGSTNGSNNQVAVKAESATSNGIFATSATNTAAKFQNTGASSSPVVQVIAASTQTGNVWQVEKPASTTIAAVDISGNSTVAGAIKTSGTAGAGYLEILTQSSNPAAPASGFRFFAASSGQPAWKRQSDGFVRTLDGSLTADRTYTLQDFTGTIIESDGSGNVGVGAAASLGHRIEAWQAGSSEFLAGDTTAFAAGVGGGITFVGAYTAVPNYAFFSAIRGYKINGTTGDFKGGLKFFTQPGTSLTEIARVTETGNWRLGAVADPSVRLHVGVGGTGATAESIWIDSGSASGGHAKLGLYRNTILKGVVAVSGSASGVIGGDAANDVDVVSTQAMNFSTDNAATSSLVLGGKKDLTNNTATTVVNVTDASDTTAAVQVTYSVEVNDGGSHHQQNEIGTVVCSVANANAVITQGGTNGCTKFGNQQIISASGGTLTVTWTLTAANPALLQINSNTSLTQTINRVTYEVHNLTRQVITPQ